MIALIQRVKSAHVAVDDTIIGAIDQGILALIGFAKGDEVDTIESFVNRILNYRIFTDSEDKMNLSLRDIGGGLLLIPQFTLAADTRKGNRPSFSSAAPPDIGLKLFDQTVTTARTLYAPANVETGEFGANMQVELINDGPVTFWLQSK